MRVNLISMKKNINELDKIVIKFVGDSGDGMQLTGTQFTDTSALYGNDLATFPDFPAEIRAPQGTVPGVSGFQVQIGSVEVLTPGDAPDVLVCMNPAALKANLSFVNKGKTIILDDEGFKSAHKLKKAQWDSNPLEDDTLKDYNVIIAPITKLTSTALKDTGIGSKNIDRCKNMFALGIVYFMFNRPLEHTLSFLNQKFAKKLELADANIKALYAGFNYAETIEAISSNVMSISAASLKKGTYRNIMGNQATAWGLLAAANNAQKELFFGSYPITPASDILHEIARLKQFGSKVFQAEDEIAAICAVIGASFAGNLAVTSTSGPGMALKGEAIGLAIMTELPIVVIDVQRGGPSTGLPTKTEQSDLMQALLGRNGESPAIVIAASQPSNCFDFAYLACKLALEHMTPVILLSDGYIANGAGPWRIKSSTDLPKITIPNATKNDDNQWFPYSRNPESLARQWAIPGMKGFEHRIGGLEKQDVTGNVSYDPANHQHMTNIRQEKINRVANYIPEQLVEGSQVGDLLLIGWGGTYGTMHTALKELKNKHKVGLAHFNYISPLPKNTASILANYKKILVCELNTGQFVNYLRMQFPEFQYLQYNKVQGLPFSVAELTQVITENLK